MRLISSTALFLFILSWLDFSVAEAASMVGRDRFDAAFGVSKSNDELFRAAAIGDLGALVTSISRGDQVDGRDQSSWTALMYAAAAGRIGIVEKLVESGADPNATTERGLTPLMIAVINRQLLATDQLLLVGADAGIETPDGLTAWNLALQKGYYELLRPLNQPLRGIAVVLDTETIRVDGYNIHLFGISGRNEPYRSTLASVLGDNTVVCGHVEDRSFQCFVGKYDVAEIALINGLAEAKSNAPKNYIGRQKIAQEKSLGIWRH